MKNITKVNFLESQFLWSGVKLRLMYASVSYLILRSSCQAMVSKHMTVKLGEFVVCAVE